MSGMDMRAMEGTAAPWPAVIAISRSGIQAKIFCYMLLSIPTKLTSQSGDMIDPSGDHDQPPHLPGSIAPQPIRLTVQLNFPRPQPIDQPYRVMRSEVNISPSVMSVEMQRRHPHPLNQ